MESISRQSFTVKKAMYLQHYAITQTVFECTLKDKVFLIHEGITVWSILLWSKKG